MKNGKPFLNVEGTTIPAGAVLEFYGEYDANNGWIKVRKCTRDNVTDVYFNGPGEVLADGVGECYPAFPSATAGIDPGSLPLALRQTLGTANGSWLLDSTKTGFVAIAQVYDDMVDVQPQQAAVGTGWWFAELTAVQSTSTTPGVGEVDGDQKEYSWVERIETSVPGVWKDGTTTGTFSACVAEDSGGASATAYAVRVTGETPSPGELVMMRSKPGSSTRFEFTINKLLATGNTSAEYTGSTGDGPAEEIKLVPPLRATQDAIIPKKWTYALIPPNEEGAEGYTAVDLVTNVCPVKKWLSISLSGGTLETLVATPVLGDTETPGVSVEVVTGIIVETTPIKLLTGSAGDPLCTEDPLDCCPVWYCVDGDVITQGGSLPPPEGTSVLGPFDTEVEADAACLCSTCEPCAGMEALPSGTTHVVLAGVDTGAGDNGCGEFESYAHRTVFEKQWSFCLPLGCVYTIRVENQTTPGIPSQAGSCEGGDDLDIVVHNGGCEGTVVQSLVTGNCCTTPEFPLELVVPELPTDPVDLIEDCAVVTVTYSFSYPHDDAWVDPSMEFDLVVTLECGTET